MLCPTHEIPDTLAVPDQQSVSSAISFAASDQLPLSVSQFAAKALVLAFQPFSCHPRRAAAA
jgi:hypothetical protein